MKKINVVGAIIIDNGKILCAQRGPTKALPYKWEFPGGKIEKGETPQQALKREIQEEMMCLIEIGDQVVETIPPYDFGEVRLTTFYCKLIDGNPVLTEHAAIKWLAPSELPNLDWAPADIPAVQKVICKMFIGMKKRITTFNSIMKPFFKIGVDLLAEIRYNGDTKAKGCS